MAVTPVLTTTTDYKMPSPEHGELQSLTVSVKGGYLDVLIQDPDGNYLIVERLAAPVSPLQVTTKVIQTHGLAFRLAPGAGASYWWVS